MTTFPTPVCLPHPSQRLPQPGTPLTEAALLSVLYSHLPTLEALVVTLHSALEHTDFTFKVTGPLLDLLWQDLNNLVDLLNAWWEHKPPEELLPLARRVPDGDTDA